MTTFENDRGFTAVTASEETVTRRVWDWPVRVFHWTLVLAFIGAFVTNHLGVGYFKLHSFFGYGVIVLVTFRLVWGVVGTRHARFVNFVRGPRASARYLRAIIGGWASNHAGHNPLGALMVVSLLLALGVQAIFGLFADDEIFNVGPLAALVSKEHSLLMTSLHRKLFYVIAAAAALHLGAVVAHVVIKREPLIRAMVTGRKPAHSVQPGEEIHSSRGWLALAVFVAVACAFAAIVYNAPTPGAEFAGL
jgi:cytochrome b